MELKLKFKNDNQDILLIDDTNENIKFINFNFNSSLNNVKLAINGTMDELIKLIDFLDKNSSKCVEICIDNLKIGGVKDENSFIEGNSTLVSSISNEPIFNNYLYKSFNGFYLNIDYYYKK